MIRTTLLAGVLFGALVMPATAATVTLGGVEIPGQGFFSLQPVDFTETFDHDGACGLSASSPLDFVNATANPAQVQAWTNNPSPNGFPKNAILRGSVPGRHKAPTSNSSCYLASLRQNLFFNEEIEYLGFHWSSIDEYNRVSASGPFDPIIFTDFGETIDGDSLWSYFGLSPYSDQYVNITFTEEFTLPLFFESIGNWAFEIDNVSIRYRGSPVIASAEAAPTLARAEFAVAEVPAPSALVLIGLGTMALIARQRHIAERSPNRRWAPPLRLPPNFAMRLPESWPSHDPPSEIAGAARPPGCKA